MIIWIASYPKSGNTWMRALISTFFYSNKGEFEFELLNKIPKFIQEQYISPLVDLNKIKEEPLKISEFWESAQARVNLDKRIKFFKTHNACAAYKKRWFTDEKNSLGYIYVVRDPRSVVCSLATHSSISMTQAVDEILNENNIGYNGPYKLAELPGSWKINYLSWKKEKQFQGILIKYEDLIDNTEIELKKVISFLKKTFINYGYKESYFLQLEKNLLKNINSCKFSKLSKMENEKGFTEARNIKFFRIGKKDSWKDELTPDLRRKIEVSFKDEMIELGYL
jgi:hypothetical protein